MATQKVVDGKIKNIDFSISGRGDDMVGIVVTLEEKDSMFSCVTHNLVFVDMDDEDGGETEDAINCKNLLNYIFKLMKKAGVRHLKDLKNKKVEITYENNKLVDWKLK